MSDYKKVIEYLKENKVDPEKALVTLKRNFGKKPDNKTNLKLHWKMMRFTLYLWERIKEEDQSIVGKRSLNKDYNEIAITGYVKHNLKNLNTAQYFLKDGPLAILPFSKNNFSFVWSVDKKFPKENINSVIEAWEPGSFGGQAVGEIIFGDVNPSGKLPLTFPRSVGQLQMVYNHKPSQYFHKYAKEKITPLYPFGHGLSYSEFKYSDLEVNKPKSENSLINVSFIISNNSDSFGEEIVQIYFRDSYSSVTRPVKELLKYKRVSLKPRESKRMSFSIPVKDLAFYDLNMNLCVEKGNFEFMVGGSSKNKGLIKSSLQILERYNF